MKSIKPGRGPSMMGGIMSVFIGIFGVVWTIVAGSIGGGFFALFGIIFVVFAVVIAIFHFKNATGKNRYSTFDIVNSNEEPDPLNERFGTAAYTEERDDTDAKYCPWCGAAVEPEHKYCMSCGKELL